MYRQVSVVLEDGDLQQILYRKNPADHLQEYRLCTVTYGTKSASYLATRCLTDMGRFTDDPKLQRVITQHFYVDDLLSGGSSVDECYQIYNSLLTHLQPAGFSLRKWCSNSVELIEKIPTACDDPTFVLKLTEEEMVTALGLTWQPETDCFRFAIKPWHLPQNMTKRILLSDINSVYDPLGLIAPLLIKGKIFIRQLWNSRLIEIKSCQLSSSQSGLNFIQAYNDSPNCLFQEGLYIIMLQSICMDSVTHHEVLLELVYTCYLLLRMVKCILIYLPLNPEWHH